MRNAGILECGMLVERYGICSILRYKVPYNAECYCRYVAEYNTTSRMLLVDYVERNIRNIYIILGRALFSKTFSPLSPTPLVT